MSPAIVATGFYDDPLPTRSKTDYPFAKYADSRYPLLQIAAENGHMAGSCKVDWLVDGPDGRETWVNFTQILRTPFTPDEHGERALYTALEKHLRDAENVLWYGIPSYNAKGRSPVGSCGGALHYLKRNPLRADRFALRVLQDMVLLQDRQTRDSAPVGEFLSEFSLEVIPAPEIKPYRAPEPRAWRQGSSLTGGGAA